MIRMLRSSALSLALTYVALGIVALVLFAAPLWYAWQVTIQDSRTELLQIDSQRLAEVLRREGAQGAKAFIDARVRMQIAGERILLLTDASLHPLSGNLPAWPSNVPTEPGSYKVKIELGDRGVQTALVHVATLGGYNLLVGRDNSRPAPLRLRGARRSRPCCKCRGVIRTGRGTEKYRSRVSIGWTRVGLGRSGSARSGTEQFDRQRAEVCACERLDRGSGGQAQRRYRPGFGVGRWPGNRRFGKVQSGGTLLSRRCEPRHSGRRLRVESRAGGGQAAWQRPRAVGQEPGPARCDHPSVRCGEPGGARGAAARDRDRGGDRIPHPSLVVSPQVRGLDIFSAAIGGSWLYRPCALYIFI